MNSAYELMPISSVRCNAVVLSVDDTFIFSIVTSLLNVLRIWYRQICKLTQGRQDLNTSLSVIPLSVMTVLTSFHLWFLALKQLSHECRIS